MVFHPKKGRFPVKKIIAVVLLCLLTVSIGCSGDKKDKDATKTTKSGT